MRIGPPAWRCCTTDELGVPTGGMYGDVRRWEPELEKHGLLLAWSWIWYCFAIYTKRPGSHKCTCQMLLKRGRAQPIPLTREVVDTFVFLRETSARTNSTIARAIADNHERRKKEAMQKEVREESAHMARESTDRAMRALGLKTRPVTVQMPGL